MPPPPLNAWRRRPNRECLLAKGPKRPGGEVLKWETPKSIQVIGSVGNFLVRLADSLRQDSMCFSVLYHAGS